MLHSFYFQNNTYCEMEETKEYIEIIHHLHIESETNNKTTK